MAATHDDAPRDPLELDEYRPGASAVLPDSRRWPTLTEAGARELARWRGHPHAPDWTHSTGDRLSAQQAAAVARPPALDGWLDAHLEVARRLIFYRDMPGLDTLADFPPITRDHLVDDVAAFVPLDADIGAMLHGSSSGSTGAALVVPDHVEDTARTFHLVRELVAVLGIAWEPDPKRMALAYVVNQRDAFTYVSLVSSFAHRPMVRVNLDRGQWPAGHERGRFLADANPQLISGDPASLECLLADDLAAAVRPVAIVSGAVELAAPLRAALERRFGCPVIDLYGLHETRPIAWRADDGPFRLVPRRVHVEALDEHGVAVPDGEVGELTVTAGENPFLPLVRYRTGDFGALVTLPGGARAIDGLQGRAHVTFEASDGAAVPAVDLTQHLQAHGARGWSVVQAADGAVSAVVAGGDEGAIAAALTALFGDCLVEVRRVRTVRDLGQGKPRRYARSRPD